MKKSFIVIIALVITVFGSIAQADELSKAYEKEYAFLKAQKAELLTRLRIDRQEHEKRLAEAKERVINLQQILLDINERVNSEKETLTKVSKSVDDSSENFDITVNVVSQARLTLETYGITLPDDNQTTDLQKLSKAFNTSASLYIELSSLRKSKGSFYLPTGKKSNGEIVFVGNVAAYGIANEAAGALAPAGMGRYKLWNAVDSSDDAKVLYAGEMKESLDIFIYENLDKEVDYVKEKTFEDWMEGGGTIGYMIMLFGVFGLMLLAFRAFRLTRAKSNVVEITNIVVSKVDSGRGYEALDALEGYSGSTARVVKAVLRNIDKDREHVEDVVMEAILNESSQIDKYGAFIMVIAAVAPLMGLLGTVTGMIQTFDVITEFGTGDPKLLAGGISTALITTMQGLIVAIPLLLLGNLVSGWAQNIKDSMEQSALHIINLYERGRA